MYNGLTLLFEPFGRAHRREALSAVLTDGSGFRISLRGLHVFGLRAFLLLWFRSFENRLLMNLFLDLLYLGFSGCFQSGKLGFQSR